MELNINEIITTIVVGVLLPIASWLFALLREYLMAKTGATKVSTILEQAVLAVELAVKETAQVYVDGIKGTPEWDDVAHEAAKNKALSKAKEILGAEGVKLLDSVTSNANVWLKAAIEAAVRDDKHETQLEGSELF